jgi:hypothetical protein
MGGVYIVVRGIDNIDQRAARAVASGVAPHLRR